MSDSDELLPEYDYSIEKLLHLRCTVCSGWWSATKGDPARVYHCPYCGIRLAPAQYPDDPPRPRRAAKEVPL